MDMLWIGLGLLLFCFYLIHINRSISSIPQDVATLSPTRFTIASIKAAYHRLSKTPIQVKLPPKTGRRYIIVGGSGFLPGWIVVQLLARGEDPKRVRIVDVRPPTRQDMTTGAAAEVAFIETDVTNAEAVMAAFTAPWPDNDESPITVFHSAANIRFWERAKFLLPLSNRVNLQGTKNVIAASLKVGASILIFTSSASIAVRRNHFWVWPWQRCSKRFVQVLDDNSPLPTAHDQFFSNYAVSKAEAEQLVRGADKAVSAHGVILRTGCIRPGNGVYGPGGDALAGSYLVRKQNTTWVESIVQSFIYVENCAIAHLLYEQRLLEMDQLGYPDIGGQAFNVVDPNPPIAFSDVHAVLTTLTNGETKFPHAPPVLMLVLAHVLEAYYILRLLHPILSFILPPIKGEAVVLQPSLFSLTQIHLVFDDSRARKSPEEGGLGFEAPFTSLEGLCNLLIEWGKEGKREEEKRVVGGRASFGLGMDTNWVQK